MDKDTLRSRSVIIEPSLLNPKNYNVGQDTIGGEVFSSFGEEVKTVYTGKDGKQESGYGGARLRVVRGGINELLNLPGLTPQEELAIQKAQAYDHVVFDAYGGHSLVASRRMYDVLQGTVIDRKDKQEREIFLSGVVDPSFRIGGGPMALTEAYGVLRESDVSYVEARSATRYGHDPLPNGMIEVFNIRDSHYGLMKFGVAVTSPSR